MTSSRTAAGRVRGRRDRSRPRVVADRPRAVPGVVWPALVLAASLLGLAFIGVRDLVADLGWADGDPWTADLVERLDGADLAAAPWWIAALLVVVGAALVALAVRPARTTHRQARDGLDLWLTPDALAAMVEATADRVAGVVSAEATPRRGGRRIRVRVHARTDPASVAARVEERLQEVGVQHLVPRTRTTVGAKQVGR